MTEAAGGGGGGGAGASKRDLDLDALVAGVFARDRAVLGRAITLVESQREDDQAKAQELLARLLPRANSARRIGISGVPGAGKSTFIEALGLSLIERGHRVAVLAVDPTSAVSGGSILGDKTRMEQLSVAERAFIRPSPSGGTLGGVAKRTRESMLVCEAAGYDVLLVETVGVGQSEVLVSEMVDLFLVLVIAGAGDELQGIKRGIFELADIVAVNKADGDNAPRAERARRELASALHLMRSGVPGADVPVLAVSALTGAGLENLWHEIVRIVEARAFSGELDRRRAQQRLSWMWNLVEERVLASVRTHPAVASAIPDLEREVLDGTTPPALAAQRLLTLWRS